ncbi:sortase domain-bontaining protein [Salinibacterium sp.]|uniref:sortase n=1 Tax=Salinibacterium sp. TaxID=1915057 RepID=UPI00286C66D5|nr:sortase [Salinibacterium sp.]
MTLVAEPEVDAGVAVVASTPAKAPQPRKAPPAKKPPKGLPIWLRKRPNRPRNSRPAPTPRDIRWWVGVIWLLLSALLLGFVTHVTIIGSLQHSRAQYVMYQQLRSDLALAITPLGQLDVDGKLVPNGTPLGLISVDRLGINEVFVQGTAPSDLTNGPGHRRDTVLPGQEGTSIIMGRQATYGGPFGSLSALIPGDEITVTTGQGKASYTVFGVRREGDLLPEALASGEGRLELITANGVPLAPSGALHIDAALESDVNETPSPVFTKEVLDPSEFEMGGDSTGWFPLLFWLQWLTVAVIALRWVRGRWGMWQTWMIAVPVVLALGAATADAAMTLLPNLL